MNKVLLCGNLTKNVDVRTNKDGVKICKGIVAIKRDYGTKNNVDYVPFTVIGSSADYVETRGLKGARVEIVGSWNHSIYQDKDGNQKSSDSVLVNEITIISKKESNEVVKDNNYNVVDDEDLPF